MKASARNVADPETAEPAGHAAIEELVRIPDQAGVDTSVARPGSAAQVTQSKSPGDYDFFQRINIRAATRREASAILADLVRRKALSTREGAAYRLMEVSFGEIAGHPLSHVGPLDATRPVIWDGAAVATGSVAAFTPNHEPRVITWEEASDRPGWCRFVWLAASPAGGELAKASVSLEATWETPAGTVVPLDAFMEPYFREVRLETESIPMFSGAVDRYTADALNAYAGRLASEIRTLVGTEPKNFGKAARRMHILFRLLGRVGEARYVRQLFDEPASTLYDVWPFMESIESASSGPSLEAVLAHADALIGRVIHVLEGEQESALVTNLRLVRDEIGGAVAASGSRSPASPAGDTLLQLINDFFYDRLTASPNLRDYVMELESDAFSVG